MTFPQLRQIFTVAQCVHVLAGQFLRGVIQKFRDPGTPTWHIEIFDFRTVAAERWGGQWITTKGGCPVKSNLEKARLPRFAMRYLKIKGQPGDEHVALQTHLVDGRWRKGDGQSHHPQNRGRLFSRMREGILGA